MSWHLNSSLSSSVFPSQSVTILPWSPLSNSDNTKLGISRTLVPFFNVISYIAPHFNS